MLLIDPRLTAYADLCHAVAIAGIVLWFEMVGEEMAGIR